MIVHVHDLWKQYGRFNALHGLEFGIPEGSAFALVGPNGAGKTTTISLCAPDYSPYPGHTLPDALSRFGGTLPFYDPAGLIRYPVGGPQLSEASVLVTAFQPTEHFVRRVVIPAVRLQDWEPQIPASAVVSQ